LPVPDIPEDAITAAAEALRDHPHASGAYSWRVRAKVVLEAAAPAIRADERRRIAREIDPDRLDQLADRFDDDPFAKDDLRRWAALLREDGDS
jgi:hypothetical protein